MASATVNRLKRKLPERLAQIRGDRSQRQFARDLGVFQQNVNRYESGTTPHTDFLITLSMKEHVSIDWLLLARATGTQPEEASCPPCVLRCPGERASASWLARRTDPGAPSAVGGGPCRAAASRGRRSPGARA